MRHAQEFCRRRQKWKCICDLTEDSDTLYYGWDDLNTRERSRFYGPSDYAESADRICRVSFGFVDEWGSFWERRLPPRGNLMMVFRVGGKRGKFRWER